MRIVKVLCLLIFVLAIGPSLRAETIAAPDEGQDRQPSVPQTSPDRPVVIPVLQSRPPKQTSRQQRAIQRDQKYLEELEKSYQSVVNTPAPNPAGDFTAAADSGPFAQTAKECGESRQARNTPANHGGRTMCGRAVAEMIKCMAPSIGGASNCQGNCGNGKDFVRCTNGQMDKCGYAKISPTDERCKQAGAVLSYTKSPTSRGAMYGHVEFVCGANKYCSVYRAPHDRPWPRTPADSCWFPKGTTNTRGR